MRIVLGKIDAVPAAGGLMAIKVQANTGTTYEILVDPERARIFAEAIMANWDEAPLIQAKASAQEAASPQRPRKATQAPKPPKRGRPPGKRR